VPTAEKLSTSEIDTIKQESADKGSFIYSALHFVRSLVDSEY
jgi:hypothetical protein